MVIHPYKINIGIHNPTTTTIKQLNDHDIDIVASQDQQIDLEN